jgi:calcineurin-like phosphoesterase family protein
MSSSVRVLAVSDRMDAVLWHDASSVGRVDLILACGDLPFDYLDRLMGELDVPLVFVPGNHDPDVDGYRQGRGGLMLRAGMPDEPPWPLGAVNADGRVVDIAGLRLAGLGGSLRYSEGPNQYTQRQQSRRARRLAAVARWRRCRDHRGVDVLLTHAPPRGVGDGDDPAHQGFVAHRELVVRLAPPLLLHGHVHPFGGHRPDPVLGRTIVRNVVGRHLFDVATIPAARDSSASRHAS